MAKSYTGDELVMVTVRGDLARAIKDKAAAEFLEPRDVVLSILRREFRVPVPERGPKTADAPAVGGDEGPGF